MSRRSWQINALRAREAKDELLQARHEAPAAEALRHPALWHLAEGANPEHGADPESPVRLFSESYGLDALPQEEE